MKKSSDEAEHRVMVFQWVHSVFVIVIPVQLTVGCVGRIFHDVDTATGEVFWFVGISISHSRTCQRRSTDEMQRLQPRILFMHVCWLPQHWTHQVRVIKSNWSRLQVQDHFSEPNMATIFDAMAPGGGYNWAPLTAISMDMFIHDYSLHPLVASPVLGGEISWKVPGPLKWIHFTWSSPPRSQLLETFSMQECLWVRQCHWYQ